MATSVCSVADCDNPVLARGWCRKHYYRWYRHGDPAIVKRYAGMPRKRYEPRPRLLVGETCPQGLHEIRKYDDLIVRTECRACKIEYLRRWRQEGPVTHRQAHEGFHLDKDVLEEPQAPCSFCGDPEGGYDGICRSCWKRRQAERRLLG